MSKVIILNGPPGCGKDTVGRQFAYNIGYDPISFKYPLFKIAAVTMEMSLDEFTSCYEDRDWKDSPQDQLNGHTVRELLIQISETYVKPFFGQDYFGTAALREVRNRPWAQGFVFTDGGFPAEIELFAQQGHEVILVHMYREGCDFSNDSRNYVLTNTVSHIYTLNNNGTVQEAIDALEGILNEHNERVNPPNFDERELVSGDSEPVPNMARPVRRNRPQPSYAHLARAYGAGPNTVRGLEEAEAVSNEAPRAVSSSDFEAIIRRAEERQRQREADRARQRAEVDAAVAQLSPTDLQQAEEAVAAFHARREERVRETSNRTARTGSVGWTTTMEPAAFFTDDAPASAATIVDESEIMSEG